MSARSHAVTPFRVAQMTSACLEHVRCVPLCNYRFMICVDSVTDFMPHSCHRHSGNMISIELGAKLRLAQLGNAITQDGSGVGASAHVALYRRAVVVGDHSVV